MNNISAKVQIITEEWMHQMFSFPNIAFKYPVALIYNSFHIYFRLKYSLLYSHPSSTSHGLAIYAIIRCLLSCQNCCTVRRNFVSRVNAIFLD
jgi:hypothetical protein